MRKTSLQYIVIVIDYNGAEGKSKEYSWDSREYLYVITAKLYNKKRKCERSKMEKDAGLKENASFWVYKFFKSVTINESELYTCVTWNILSDIFIK